MKKMITLGLIAETLLTSFGNLSKAQGNHEQLNVQEIKKSRKINEKVISDDWSIEYSSHLVAKCL